MAKPNAREFNAEKACEVLLDAAFYPDGEAAKRHNVSRRTVINYRNRLKEDPAFAQLFTEKLNALKSSTDWEERLPATLRCALKAAEESFEQLDKHKPESLNAIVEAIAVLSDALLTLRMLDVHLVDDSIRAEAPKDRQVFGSTNGFA